MDTSWGRVSKDFNRYIQTLRRQFPSHGYQYIRTVEAHTDSYPHIHTILQTKQAITVENDRYFDNLLYQRWKKLWTCGLSDYQSPRSKREPILYLVKYISKDTPTRRTLWKKLLRNVQTAESSSIVTSKQPKTVQNAHGKITTSEEGGTYHQTNGSKYDLTLSFCKKHKIKQLTWSRGFVFPSLGGVRGESPMEKFF